MIDDIDITTIAKTAPTGPWLVCTDMTAVKLSDGRVLTIKTYESGGKTP
ncbi:hypothetical protein QVN49_11035 [Megasphaera hexanoica]|nr:hypothetical protein [Megasphaera hexanoica]